MYSNCDVIGRLTTDLHMSDGMYFADEEVTHLGSGPQPTGNWSGGHSAGRGTETCSIVETMQSMRFAYEITGNVSFMDRLERLAFNALPAALWPHVTANVYHHRSNQLNCEGQYGFNLFYCCTSNVHQGWPYFVLASAHTTPNGTVVVSGWAPSVSTLQDGNVLTVTGNYPFSDTAVVSVSKAAELSLRAPCWADGATVTTTAAGQGRVVAVATAPGCAHFHVTVAASATLNVTFHNSIRVYTWHANTTDGSFSNGTRREPFNSTPMGVNSISFGSPHVRPMWALSTCGEPDEIKKHTHPKNIPLFVVCRHGRGASPERGRDRGAPWRPDVRPPPQLDRHLYRHRLRGWQARRPLRLELHGPARRGATAVPAVPDARRATGGGGWQLELRAAALEPEVRGGPRPRPGRAVRRHGPAAVPHRRPGAQPGGGARGRLARPVRAAALARRQHGAAGDAGAGAVRVDQHPHLRLPRAAELRNGSSHVSFCNFDWPWHARQAPRQASC